VIGIKFNGEGTAPVPGVASTSDQTVNQTVRASAHLVPTIHGHASPNQLNGYVEFETQPDSTVLVRYFFCGLPPLSSHNWYIA